MKTLSAREAAALLRPNDEVALPLGPGQPPALLEALSERDDFDGLTVFTALLLGFYPLFTKPGVRLLSGFYGPIERILLQSGADVHFIPADFRRFELIAEERRPRVVATTVAPADANGNYSLSLHAGATVTELKRCGKDPERLLVAEVNRQLPRTLGLGKEHPHTLHESEIDILIEDDRAPFTLPEAAPGEVEKAIAGHVRPFVPDGATLQVGIGGIPDAVIRLLAEGNGGDYGIHSEMFTTGLMHLHKAGKVTNRKGQYDGVSVTTFSLGSTELYEWLHECREVRFLPVAQVNTPAVVAANRNFVSINGAIAVDLYGQVAADTVGGRQYSGIGGHEDFVSGASFSDHGTSLVCLPSTATVDGALVSRIAATFAPGQTVTTPRHQIDTVITEYGAAELAGKTVEERREALLSIAHPDLREELRRQPADS